MKCRYCGQDTDKSGTCAGCDVKYAPPRRGNAEKKAARLILLGRRQARLREQWSLMYTKLINHEIKMANCSADIHALEAWKPWQKYF